MSCKQVKTLKKLAKKIVLCFIVFLIIIVAFLFAASEYLFSYSLVRKNEKPDGANRLVPSSLTEENAKIIEKSKKLSQNKKDKLDNLSEKEKIYVCSHDNLKLVATFVKNENDNHNYAIIIHGYSKRKEDVYDIAYEYFLKNFSVLVPDLRAHGESEGKYIGMGWLDKEDLKVWINKIVSKDKDAKIFLHGISMGASAAMMLSGDNFSENIKGIIEDSGFTSVSDIFISELETRFHFPSFAILDFMTLVTYLHAGYNIKEASCTSQVSKAKIPILIIHGSDDNFTPLDMAYKIQNASKSKNMLVIYGAGHTTSRFLEPEKYYSTVWNFINSL